MDLRSKGERVLVEVAVGMHLSLGFRLTSNRKTNIESTRYHTPPHKSVQDEKHAIPEKKWCRFFLKHSLGSKEERNNHHVLPPRPAQLYLISETFEDRSDDQLLSSRIPLSPPPRLPKSREGMPGASLKARTLVEPDVAMKGEGRNDREESPSPALRRREKLDD